MPPTPRIIRRHSSAPHLGEEEEANKATQVRGAQLYCSPLRWLWRFPQSIASGMGSGTPGHNTTTLRKVDVKVMISHDAQFTDDRQSDAKISNYKVMLQFKMQQGMHVYT